MASVVVQFLRRRLQEVQRRADGHPAVRGQPAEEQKEFGPSHPQRNRPQDVRN